MRMGLGMRMRLSPLAGSMRLAIVPKWTSRMSARGVRYVPLSSTRRDSWPLLPLAAAWIRGSRDPARDDILALLRSSLSRYAALA